MQQLVTQQPQKCLLTGVMAPSPPHRAPHFCSPPCHTSYSISDTSHSSLHSHLLVHTLGPARSLGAPPALWITTPLSNSPTHLPRLFPLLGLGASRSAGGPAPLASPCSLPAHSRVLLQRTREASPTKAPLCDHTDFTRQSAGPPGCCFPGPGFLLSFKWKRRAGRGLLKRTADMEPHVVC